MREGRLVQVGAGREEVGSEMGKKREPVGGDGREEGRCALLVRPVCCFLAQVAGSPSAFCHCSASADGSRFYGRL